ncbi:tRNA (guanosine(18)-2'-O)-methyltransferase [Bacteroidota bacterium]|nr:tRNA (guanosine(18)-2'-O)-methyltransferase [Bacteroidota bacterium]
MTPARFDKLQAVLQRRQFDLTIVLENVFDPHNISAVMRTCDAVGVQELYILNTKIPRHKKWGARSSSSAAKWLTVHQFEDTDQCFDSIRSRGLKILTTHLDTQAVPLYAVDFTRPLALVFGNEHSGVSDEIRVKADGNFVIPQVGIIQSLNISVACAVTLYEAFRQKEKAGHYQGHPQEVEARLRLSKEWELE